MQRVQQLHNALMDAFTIKDLDQMLRFAFDMRIEDLSEKGTKGDMFLDVIDASIAGGWAPSLANEAYKANPGNKSLSDFNREHVRAVFSDDGPVFKRGDQKEPYFAPETRDMGARVRELEILFRGMDGFNGMLSKMRHMERRMNIVIAALVAQPFVIFLILLFLLRGA